MALRLMRVCVCGHDFACHQNMHSIPFVPEYKRCQYVDWERADGARLSEKTHVVCQCPYWRPLLIPRLRNVPLEVLG